MTTPSKRLAIIGGGASATILLAHIALRPEANNWAIDVYDRSGRFARGIAYSTDRLCHLLNVRAEKMSAIHGKEGEEEFARWAEIHGYGPLDFVPRKIYGDYLQEKLDEARRILQVRLIEDDVEKSGKDEGGFVLSAGGQKEKYDAVVLASGNVSPLKAKSKGAVEGYFEDPWEVDFSGLLRLSSIALIGSGLSAVDMVLSLIDAGYKGDILIFSRKSLLPRVHTMPVPYSVDDLAEAAECCATPLKALVTLRRRIGDAQKRSIPWQSVMDHPRNGTNAIWQSWSEEDRKKFMKRLLTYWNIHRHRMAPEIGAKIDARIEQGQVKFIKDDVVEITDGPIIVGKKQQYTVGAVLNCLGYRYDEGRDLEVSYKIGPAAFGNLFETTAIPEIRAQASEITEKLFL